MQLFGKPVLAFGRTPRGPGLEVRGAAAADGAPDTRELASSPDDGGYRAV